MADKNVYDFEERSLQFALRVDQYILYLPKNLPNYEHSKQLTRSAGAIGANYIEANNSLGKKDFIMRLKISRKEARESRHWLRLTLPEDGQKIEKDYLVNEVSEFVKILSAMIIKAER